MEKQDKRAEKIEIKSEIAKVSNEGFKASKPSVSIKYPESIHLETKCMLKGTDQGHWDDIWSTEQNKSVGLVSMQDDVIEIKGTLYSTRVTTFNEYVGFLNLVKQDEINKFGTEGEILGLSKQDGEEIKRCYINYLDISTSYYKTARVCRRRHNTIPSMPTGSVEKGKGYIFPAFHQCDFGDNQAPNKEAVSKKGKEKIEHFGIEL
ncbi:hypothetical protein Tco_0153507 [Tanacetum coccineum]